MPGRVRTSSEADYEGSCLEGFPNSRVSAKVAVGQTNVVDDGRLNLGRRLEKRQRQKACGLDRRMSGMMKRANTSFVADFTATKRPRNASGSSSSVISSEAPPKTPADAIHERARGNGLGDGFSIIKLEERGLIGFGDDLPSWNDRRKEMQEDKNIQRKELPGWLSSTFVSLEPGHPLRTLALSKDQTTINSPRSPQHISEESAGPQTRHIEPQDNSIFAYEPPDIDTRTAPVLDSQPEAPAANAHAFETHTVFPELVYDNTSGQCQQEYMPEETITYVDPAANTLAFKTHAELPGPVCNNTSDQWQQVYMPEETMTNVDPTYRSPSFPADIPPTVFLKPSFLTPSGSTNSRRSSYNPYATPGPAANFSVFAYNVKDGLSRMLFADEGDGSYTNHSSDPLTLVDNTAVMREPLIVSTDFTSIDEQNLMESKPYSTPGPIFVAPPIVYFDSPTENPADSDPTEPAYDDIQTEIDILDANDKPPAFVANFHPSITADAFPRLSLSQSSPLGVDTNIDDSLMLKENLTPNHAHDDTLPFTQLPSSFLLKTPPRRENTFCMHAAIKGRSTNALPPSSPLNNPLLSSPYDVQGTGQRKVVIDETTAANDNNRTSDRSEEALGEDKDGDKLSARKERPAFAPAPGIYLSPLQDEPSSSDAKDAGEAGNDDKSEKCKEGNNVESNSTNALAEENIWNLSQATQDSIESWSD